MIKYFTGYLLQMKLNLSVEARSSIYVSFLTMHKLFITQHHFTAVLYNYRWCEKELSLVTDNQTRGHYTDQSKHNDLDLVFDHYNGDV